MIEKFGSFFSWNVIDEIYAFKECDLSFFKYKGTGVPSEITWYFDAINLKPGGKRNLNFEFNGNIYKGNINRTISNRVRIFWEEDLSKILNQYNKGEKVYVGFEKLSNDYYKLLIIII